VLRHYLLGGYLTAAQARWLAEKAEADLRERERPVATPAVLKLVERTRHSSYDCGFVALADAHGVRLVTGDHRVARLFPETAVLLEAFEPGR
jgi:hypothetical protein